MSASSRLSTFCCICGLLLAYFLGGCATTAKPPDAQSPLLAEHLARAEQAETRGDLREALLSWEVVVAIDPADSIAVQKVEQLRKLTNLKSDEYFQKGLKLLEEHAAKEAQQAFLAALYLDPDHPKALTYLRAQMGGKDYALHTLQEGESLSLVAKQHYGDVYRYDLLAYFNNLDPNESVHPGMVLNIPSMKGVEIKRQPQEPTKKETVLSKAPEYPEESAEEMVLVSLDSREMEEMVVETSLIRRMLDDARRALNMKQYGEAASKVDRILEIDRSNSEARYLSNVAHYNQGKQNVESKQYEKALRFLDKVDPDFQDSGKLRTICRQTLAESHYRNGVKYFAEEKLKLAVAELEKTLDLNPDHPKARRDLEDIRGLIEKLERFK